MREKALVIVAIAALLGCGSSRDAARPSLAGGAARTIPPPTVVPAGPAARPATPKPTQRVTPTDQPDRPDQPERPVPVDPEDQPGSP